MMDERAFGHQGRPRRGCCCSKPPCFDVLRVHRPSFLTGSGLARPAAHQQTRQARAIAKRHAMNLSVRGRQWVKMVGREGFNTLSARARSHEATDVSGRAGTCSGEVLGGARGIDGKALVQGPAGAPLHVGRRISPHTGRLAMRQSAFSSQALGEQGAQSGACRRSRNHFKYSRRKILNRKVTGPPTLTRLCGSDTLWASEWLEGGPWHTSRPL